MSVLRASILCSKVKKGGPERVKRGPEGLSLFKITPEKKPVFLHHGDFLQIISELGKHLPDENGIKRNHLFWIPIKVNNVHFAAKTKEL